MQKLYYSDFIGRTYQKAPLSPLSKTLWLNKKFKKTFYVKKKIRIICYQIDKSSNLKDGNNTENNEKTVFNTDVEEWILYLEQQERKKIAFQESLVGQVCLHNLKIVLNFYFNLRNLCQIVIITFMILGQELSKKNNFGILVSNFLAFIFIMLSNAMWVYISYQLVNFAYTNYCNLVFIRNFEKLIIGYFQNKLSNYLNLESLIPYLLTGLILTLLFKPKFIESDAKIQNKS